MHACVCVLERKGAVMPLHGATNICWLLPHVLMSMGKGMPEAATEVQCCRVVGRGYRWGNNAMQTIMQGPAAFSSILCPSLSCKAFKHLVLSCVCPTPVAFLAITALHGSTDGQLLL